VDTPHEPTGARIIPLFPDRPRRPARRRADGGSSPFDDPHREELDRLLQEAMKPSPGDGGDLPAATGTVELGMSSGALYPHVPTEHIPVEAARRGFRTVELMLQTAGEYQPEFIATTAANAREAGVRVRSIHTMESLHRLLSPYARRVEEGRALFQRAIEAAVTLEAEVIVWHGPLTHEVATETEWECFIDITRGLAAACGEAGVTLGIENVSRCALSQVRHVARFARSLGEIGSREEVGFVFDPFQAVEAGANPFMMLAAMGDRVVDVHISDYREDDPSARHLPPGDGDLPWPALLRAIAGSGYRGPLMIEGALGTGDETLRRVRDRLDPLIDELFQAPGIPAPDIVPATLPEGVLQGIALFNERKFYEQHEVIEHEWHAEPGAIRRLYQGILQIGVGFHHALRGNWRGAVSLLTDGIDKVSRFLPEARGIDTRRLVAEAQACLDQIVALGPDRIDEFDAGRIPVIELVV